MTIFDLVLILAFLGCVLALFFLCYALLRQRWKQVKRILLGLGCFLVLYTVILLTAALFSPQHIFAMHQNRCFDDWCISAEQVRQQQTIVNHLKIVVAHGTFYLVTVRVSSQARATTQRALDVQVYLLDAKNQRYDPSPTGQQALDEAEQSGQPLDSQLAPSGSFTYTIVFDLPKNSSHLALAVTHGLFPEVLVIGSEQSFLHKPTIIQLQI